MYYLSRNFYERRYPRPMKSRRCDRTAKSTSIKSSFSTNRALMALALVFSILTTVPPVASAAGYADCVSISDARVEKKFSELVYTLSLDDRCQSGVRSYSLVLMSNKFTVSDVYESYVIIPSYGTEVSFSLSRYSPGSYSPSLEISSSKDLQRRVVSLPRFSIDSPVDCLQVTKSGLDITPSSYSIMLRNTCDSLDSDSFQNIQVEMQGGGLYGMSSNTQTLYSISDYGTTVTFSLSGLGSGTYFPTLKVSDFRSSKFIDLNLSSFTIKSAQAQPTPQARPSNKQLCVTGKNYTKECFAYPNFTYSICSSNPSGKVQYQSGSKWFFAWNFSGKKNLERCNSSWPFLISISGTIESTRNMRLQFNKYQESLSFYSPFKVAVS